MVRGIRSSSAPHSGALSAAPTSRLVSKRERIYLDRFWNELSPIQSYRRTTRRLYAQLYARPGAMHSAFNQFAAFNQDAIDNGLRPKTKLTIGAGAAPITLGSQMAISCV